MADIYYSHPSCNVCPFFPTSNLQTDVNGSVEAYFEKMCMLRLSEYGKLNQLACNEVSSELFCPPPPPTQTPYYSTYSECTRVLIKQ